MTALRDPFTFADAMTRVRLVIGWKAARSIARVSDRTARAWSEEGSNRRPRVDVALRLDAAYQAAGGDGAPFLEAFGFQLDVTVQRQEACRAALAAELMVLLKEFGEAMSAAMLLTQPGTSPRDAHRAFAEAQQLGQLLDAVMRRLSSFLTTGAGPAAALPGVHS